MTAAARLTFSHIGHGGLAGALTIVILLGVTVAALVGLNVEIMAEYRIVNRFGLVFEGLGSQATVAGTAVCSGGKSGFSIVA